jgi:hypothetical protein
LSFLTSGKVFAQENEEIIASSTESDTLVSAPSLLNQDSIVVVVPQEDSLAVVGLGADATPPNANIKLSTEMSSFKPKPGTAAWLAIVPGLGQIYNRKYWKLPLVYGGFVGLAYGINWNGRYYSDYKQAYSDFIDEDPTTHSWIYMLPTGQDPETVNSSSFKNSLKSKMDLYRRYRDLCIIGIAGLYVLTIVDAFVDAQLFDFDISPNLTFNIEPTIQPTINNNLTVALQCRLSF